jgi:protein-tyrosine phosphatase
MESEGMDREAIVMPRQILFVCMGNICRSPMAKGVMRSLVERAGMQENVVVDSAGTHDYHVGEQPDPRAQAAALRHGYDISGLRARQLASEDFERFDLLLAMDFNNLACLRDRCPSGLEGKIGLLMPYARKRCSSVVHDPYYRSAGDFDLVLECLEDACEGVLRVLGAPEPVPGLGVTPLSGLSVPSNFKGG